MGGKGARRERSAWRSGWGADGGRSLAEELEECKGEEGRAGEKRR